MNECLLRSRIPSIREVYSHVSAHRIAYSVVQYSENFHANAHGHLDIGIPAHQELNCSRRNMVNQEDIYRL